MTGWRRWMAAVAGLALGGSDAGAAPALGAAVPGRRVQVQAQAPPRRRRPTPAPAPAPRSGPGAADRRSRRRDRRRPRRPRRRKGPNTGRVSLLLGADWASAYYFRGIATTQNGGNNVQPYGEIGFRLLENMGPLTSLHVVAGHLEQLALRRGRCWWSRRIRSSGRRRISI